MKEKKEFTPKTTKEVRYLSYEARMKYMEELIKYFRNLK